MNGLLPAAHAEPLELLTQPILDGFHIMVYLPVPGSNRKGISIAKLAVEGTQGCLLAGIEWWNEIDAPGTAQEDQVLNLNLYPVAKEGCFAKVARQSSNISAVAPIKWCECPQPMDIIRHTTILS